MQELREPLFLGIDIKNIRKKEKNAPEISVRVNLQRDDLIYVKNVKNRMEVCGYIDPKTGLFVTEAEDTVPGSIYHKFRLEAVKFAKEELLKFLDKLEKMDEESYNAKEYKSFPVLANGLKNCLIDRQALYADLQKQVNLIASRKFPKVNEYLVFSDEEEIKHPVTAKIPYENPKNIILTKEQVQEVDRFLNVFFDDYNKFVFAWFLGAALSNLPIYDDRVSKLAVLSSSYGGSGKSTLATSMINAVFTPAYRDIKDNFDAFFAINNRFGTSALSTKRICIYSEASFNSDPLSEDHNFSGINISGIKSMVTEGYITSEAKYQDQDMALLSGFHLVLTNYPPVITQSDQAMNRRILPIMLKPTSMGEKARELGLWGRQKLDNYLKEHAKEFAAYFVSVFLSDEYAFCEQEYDYRDYTQDILDSQSDLSEVKKEGRRQLNVLLADGILKFISGVEKEQNLNLTVLKDDIKEVLGGGSPALLSDYIRIQDGTLYIDSSKSFLLRYGSNGTKIRACLKDFYGDPIKRFHKRMFAIKIES